MVQVNGADLAGHAGRDRGRRDCRRTLTARAAVTFHDHFSAISKDYAKFRPRYPRALFEWMAATVDRRELAWDCATGNGQAAVGLADDGSRTWWRPTPAPSSSVTRRRSRNIEYRQARADRSGLADGTVSTWSPCAQAVHWLPRRRASSTRRGACCVPDRRLPSCGAITSRWCSASRRSTRHPHFHDEVVGPYWPPERQLVVDRFAQYRLSISTRSRRRRFEIRCAMDARRRSATYLGTQSATERYRVPVGDPTRCPVSVVTGRGLWGGRDTVRDVHFPIFIRAG